MHFPFFDGNVQDVLVGILNVKMLRSGTKKWFIKNNKRQRTKGRKPANRTRKKWVAKVLKQHREMILKELDVNKVLPYLVYDKVFSLGEYKEILGQDSSRNEPSSSWISCPRRARVRSTPSAPCWRKFVLTCLPASCWIVKVNQTFRN